MNYDEILKKIIRRYGVRTDNIRTTQIIESRLKKHTATYADAEQFAQEIGKALTDAFREYLPEALTDGKLYRAAAEVLVEQPMKKAGRDVAEVAERIQKQLNENAGLGMNPVIPKMNQDQIDGMITGICNADSYEAGKEILMDQVGNCLEGYVDDFVRENADFQYRAGLSPTIERRTAGKCCAWCMKLAGSYPYEDVRDRGNDVFRRHRNCHCQILYDPGNGSRRRQNVHSRQWTEDGKADRIDKGRTVGIDLQQFAHKSGDYRRMEKGHNWDELSLKDTISKYARGSKPVKSDDKQKISYFSKNGKYEIKYDVKGDYFRIIDRMSESHARPCLDKNGNPVLNIMEDGKQRSATQDEYEKLTHFRNSDQKGGRK